MKVAGAGAVSGRQVCSYRFGRRGARRGGLRIAGAVPSKRDQLPGQHYVFVRMLGWVGALVGWFHLLGNLIGLHGTHSSFIGLSVDGAGTKQKYNGKQATHGALRSEIAR